MKYFFVTLMVFSNNFYVAFQKLIVISLLSKTLTSTARRFCYPTAKTFTNTVSISLLFAHFITYSSVVFSI